ncbi:MAG: 30S ribosomal protein S7 [Elusimicrobiota bacterium]|nr:30S ribosomal protein S7 [Elusimicrobiota bacterium]
MSRRPVKVRREIPPDVRYNSVLVQRFINKINYRGKKNLAMKIVYDAFDIIKEKLNEDPLKVFIQAVENSRPLVELRPRRIGGATYQVPVEVPQYRGETLAMRWLIEYARQRKGKPMREKLAEEIISAYKKENSAVIKKKEDTHKMAEANRAFAHYRW